MSTRPRRFIHAFSLLIALDACATSNASGALNDWVNANTARSERVLCKREVDGEYFFVAREHDKVRIGSRLDVTGHTKPNSFTLIWRFVNEKNAYLASDVQPLAITDRYVKVDGKIYSDNVQYQTLDLSGSRLLRVELEIKKCPEKCDGEQPDSKEVKQYTVLVCGVSLSR